MADVWAPALTLTVCPVGAVRVCRAVGEIDLYTAPQVRRALARIERGGRASRVVLDLSEVTFLGTAGMRVLITSAEQARACGYRVELVVGTHAVRRALSVGGLAEHIRVYPSLTEALTEPVSLTGARGGPIR